MSISKLQLNITGASNESAIHRRNSIEDKINELISAHNANEVLLHNWRHEFDVWKSEWNEYKSKVDKTDDNNLEKKLDNITDYYDGAFKSVKEKIDANELESKNTDNRLESRIIALEHNIF